MKKTLLIALLLAAFAPIFAFEYTHEGSTLTYTIIDSENVSVTAGTGGTIADVLVIPSSVSYNGVNYDVTEIEDKAFMDNRNFSSIELPERLQKIGYKSFVRNKITEITIPSTVTEIGCRAFYGHQMTTVTLLSSTPPAIASIKASGEKQNVSDVFYNVANVVFNIPDGTFESYVASTYWDGGNFYDATMSEEAKSVRLIDGLMYKILDENEAEVSFFGYVNETIQIPESVILKDTLRYVTKLAESFMTNNKQGNNMQVQLVLPSCLKVIGRQAFVRSSKLVGELIIPASVETIGWHAFWGCSGLDKIIFEGAIPTLLNDKNKVGESIAETFGYDIDPVTADFDINNFKITHGEEFDYNGGVIRAKNIAYKRTFTPGKWETLSLPFNVDYVTVEEDGVEYEISAWKVGPGGHFYLAANLDDKIENGELIFEVTDFNDGNHNYIIQFLDNYYADKVITFYSADEKWWEFSTSLDLPANAQMQIVGNTSLYKQTLSEKAYLLTDNNFILQSNPTTLQPFESCVMPPQVSGAALAPRMSVRLREKNDVTTSISSTQTNQLCYTKDGNVLTVYSCGQPLQIYSISGELLYDVENQESAQFSLDKGCYIIYSNGNSQKVIL